MKHATPKTIERLSGLCEQIRSHPELRERKPGVFYRRSKAFLHFHEDGDKVYADVRLSGPDFERFPCTTAREQAKVVKAIKTALDQRAPMLTQ